MNTTFLRVITILVSGVLLAACEEQKLQISDGPEIIVSPAEDKTDNVWLPKLKQLWQASGFEAPEGVARDDSYIYISNVAGEGGKKDDRGWISKLSRTGEVIDQIWVDGLQAPKGMAIKDGILYVADIDTVHLINSSSGTIVQSRSIAGAKFLNDMTVWKGKVYVADSGNAAIHSIEATGSSLFLKQDKLAGVNGLLGNGDELLVTTMTNGSLLSVSGDGSIAEIASGMINADGLGVVSDGYLVSSWPGQVFHIDKAGTVTELLNTKQAGILQNDLTVYDESLVIIPNWVPGTVTAWTVNQ